MITWSKLLKMLEVVIKMAFLVFENVYFSQNSIKSDQTLEFFELLVKIHPTKRENTFKKLNHMSFVT